MLRLRRALLLALCTATLPACMEADIGHRDGYDDGSGAFTSDAAKLVNFDFDGEMTTAVYGSSKTQVRSQLMYMVGHINGEPGVARLDHVVLTNVTSTWIGGGRYRIRYHAMMPVAWGHPDNIPTSYALVLPRRADQGGQTTFTGRYGATCNDGEPDSVNVGNYWYHYRPFASGCALADADVTRTTARVTVSADNTDGKYPEYHRMWEDGSLDVVAIFAKYADYATSPSDAGISAFNEFVAAVHADFPDAVTTPATLPAAPGPGVSDITFHMTRGDGTTVTIVALLIDGVRTAGPGFDRRYAELSPGADMILYNGHAGLGANVRALSQKGKFFPGKYQVFFMNGCDTFAYVDTTLARTRAVLNPDDPTGTKNMEIVTNAMPAYFTSLTEDSLALIHAALDWTSDPRTYQDIFSVVDPIQLVVVDGEADNVFTPGYDDGTSWNGFEANGAVGYHVTTPYQTEALAPGRYVFALTPEQAAPGGDADLRIRVGSAPTLTSTYKCPSYVANSNERCVLNVTTAAPVFIAVTGDKASVSSAYRLRAWQIP